MRALVKTTSGRGFSLRDLPEPVPGPGEVLVRVHAASLCGTDVHLYEWTPWAASRVQPPRVMGHEMGGFVEALGPGVDTVAVGALVACESHLTCGLCRECTRGDSHVCRHTQIMGVDVDGVFRERTVVPARNVWPVPASGDTRVAALMEPFGNAVHACSRGDLQGQVVGIFGCGPIGCAAVAICQAEGAAKVIAVDRSGFRLDLARRMGADECVQIGDGLDTEQQVRAAAGGDIDCALEMSGAPEATVAACRLTRPGGWVSLVGLGAPVSLDLSRDVVMKGISLHGIAGRRMFATWEATSAYLEKGCIDPFPLITHEFDMADVDAAIELMRSGLSGKIVLRPGRSD